MQITESVSSGPPSASVRLALLLLTLVAGWVDALCFLGLGKVFSSFMSGNFLFLGIALGQGDRDFLLRALSALGGFLAGAVAGTVLVSRRKASACALTPGVLVVEMALLLGFGCYWLTVPDIAADTLAQRVLLALAALAMGMQASVVLAMNIPGVATNALTGTFTLIARIGARRALGVSTPSGVSIGYLLLLCAAYGCSAGVVVLVIGYKATVFLPLCLLGGATLIASRLERDARGSAPA